MTAKKKRAVTLSLPTELISTLDELADSTSMSRTTVCTKILAKHVPILLQLRREQLERRAEANIDTS